MDDSHEDEDDEEDRDCVHTASVVFQWLLALISVLLMDLLGELLW